MPRVMIRNEWAPLKETVLGVADRIFFSAAALLQLDPSLPPLRRWWNLIRGEILQGKPYPQWKVQAYRRLFLKRPTP